nr:hypothetical protein [Tanacetum cinerariifolium]
SLLYHEGMSILNGRKSVPGVYNRNRGNGKKDYSVLTMGDEHLDTIPATESDEVIMSSVENLVPNPSVNPIIDHHCCYECGSSLNDFFCPHCTCEFCENGAHVGCNCPAQVPSFQTLPVFHNNILVVKIVRYNSLKDNFISGLPPCSVITPNEPVDSLSMGDEHLNTILVTKSNELIKSCVENLVLNPSDSEGENGCDVLACFTTFSNILFDAEYEFDSSDDQSLSDEDFLKEIFLNPWFEEEIISTKIDPHHYNAEPDLIKSMLNRDSSIISSSSKIDSLLDEFAGELTLLKSIPLGIDKTDCHPENEILLIERLLYDNSSPLPPEKFVSKNSDADIESFSLSPILDEDSDSLMEEIDLSYTPDDPMPPGIKEDDDDSKKDVLIREELLDNYSLSLPVIESYHIDILLFSRPPAKPLDGITGILNIKMMGDISKQKVKDKQEKDKIRTKPDKNEKRGKARKCQNSVIIKKAEKKLPVCYNDDDDEERYNSLKDNFISGLPSCSAITPKEPVDSLSMGDEHLNTILVTKSNELIKSCVENLVPNPIKSDGENGYDVLACFTTFSNILFNAEYEFDSSDDQSLSDEYFPKEIFSNPWFEEEIISTKIDPHHYNAESDLIKSLLNRDSSIISSSSKIDSLLDEFTGELTLHKSIPSGIDKTDFHPENEIRLIERLLYDNSSPHPPEEFIFENSDADIESFSPSPILDEDSYSLMKEIDLSYTLDDPMPSGIEEDDDDSKRDVLIREKLLDNYSLSLPITESYHFDIPLFSRPPAKPPDGNTGILNIKMMGDISEQKVPIPKLMITLVSNQEKSPDLLSYRGFEIF